MENFLVQTELSAEQMWEQFHLLKQLNPNLKEANFKTMLAEMLHYPYKMLGVFEGEKCVAISGYWVMTKFYCGRYLEMDNVVVDEQYRSKGIGKIICDELEKIALKENCRVMMLDAYLSNVAAHVFYEREGFEKKGFHFLKKLSS
jgi:GNAT superfamily N-acetyltransferase